MPIYEFSCITDGRFEALLPISQYDKQSLPCPKCGKAGRREWSLCSVFPDTLWAGYVHRNYGYFTSTTHLKAEMKRRNHVPVGDRTDREAWDKIADDARKDKDEKLKKDMRKWSEKTFGPSGLGLGGADGEKFIKEHS